MNEPVVSINYITVDIFRVIANADRLRILMFLYSEDPLLVSDLSRLIYNDTTRNYSTQTSRLLAPLRRLALVKRTHANKFVFYELTDLGREVIRMVEFINSYKLAKSNSNGTP